MENLIIATEETKCDKCIQIKKIENWNDNDKVEGKGGKFSTQFIATFSVYILAMNIGVIIAWTSPALPHLKSSRSKFRVTDAQGAWIAGLSSLSTVIGISLCPLFMNRIGRKYTMILSGLLQGIAEIMIILSQNYIHLYIAKITAGTGVGGAYSIIIIYLGEISEKKIRGISLAFTRISNHLGVLIIAIAGAFLTYDYMNRALLSIPIAFLISSLFIPETPYYYLMKGEDAKALKTLMDLRGVKNPDSAMLDIQRMKKKIVEDQKSDIKPFKELFGSGACRMSMILCSLAKATVMFSGNVAIPAFVQEILTESGSSMKPTDAAMILAGFEVLFTLPTTLVIDRFGRRTIFLVTGIITSISLAIIGAYFFLKLNLNSDVSSFTWLPLVGLVFFQLSSNMGFTVIPVIYVSELFPVKIKGPATAISNSGAGISGFFSKLAYQILKSAGGTYITFWFFSACCICGTFAVFFLAPETKGKNLEEIQEMLNRKKKRTSFIEDSVRD